MRYEDFAAILERKIFSDTRCQLLQKIADYPDRYVGLFRPTTPKGKILQNLTQSHEIRFGDALEEIIARYFLASGYTPLPKGVDLEEGEGKRQRLEIDQLFRKGEIVLFVEQKVRDDHDSTKKRGQIQNFEKKVAFLCAQYPRARIEAVFYFIDPSLRKNQKFYSEEVQRISSQYDIKAHLFYGEELFACYEIEGWKEIVAYLKRWKANLPDLPEINFDLAIEETFEEIKELPPRVFIRLFSNDEVFNQIVLTLSPERKLLRRLLRFFQDNATQKKDYQVLADLLGRKLASFEE